MQIEFTNEEILFIYGNLKKELNMIKAQKSVKFSAKDVTFYENLIAKLEKAHPELTHLSL